MPRYKSVHTGPQIDSGVARALPGGAIDTALVGKAAVNHTHAITNITGMNASRVVVSDSNGAGTIMEAPSSNGCFLRQNDSGAPYWDTEDTVASVMKVKFTSGLTEYALDQASSVTSGHLYYLKMENGVSAIRGVVGGSFTSGTVIGTLPSGYRPVSAYTGIAFATASSGTSLCTYEIETTGTITIKNLPSTYQYITLSSGIFKSA